MILWLSVIGVVAVIAIATWWVLGDRDGTAAIDRDGDRDSLPNDQLGL